MKPYTNRMIGYRASSLAAKYPLYNGGVIKDFSESDMFETSADFTPWDEAQNTATHKPKADAKH